MLVGAVVGSQRQQAGKSAGLRTHMLVAMGGAILKWHETHEVQGLTTAAGLWVTAALGVATGLGRLGTALLGALLTWVVLAVLAHIERLPAPHQRVEDNQK
jgi:putative Mg2+ transporter-C (MgtC) family protein